MPAAVDSITVAAEFADRHDAIECPSVRRDAEPGQLVVDISAGPGSRRGHRCPQTALRASGTRHRPTDPTGPRHRAGSVDSESGSAQEPREPRTPGTLAVVGAEGPARVLQDGGLAAAGYRPADVDEAQCVYAVADSGRRRIRHANAVRLTARTWPLSFVGWRTAGQPGRCYGSSPAGSGERTSDAACGRAAPWGLAGVVRAEQPDIWGGLVDLPEGSDDGIAETPRSSRRSFPHRPGRSWRCGTARCPRPSSRRSSANPCANRLIPPDAAYLSPAGCARPVDGELAGRPRRPPTGAGQANQSYPGVGLGR